MGKEEECQDCDFFFFLHCICCLTTAKRSVLKKTWEINHLSCFHANVTVVVFASLLFLSSSPCAVYT